MFDPEAFGLTLNNRERAGLIYLLLAALFVMAVPGARRLAFLVVKRLFARRLLVYWGVMTTYVVLTVLSLRALGFWAAADTKMTLYFWLTVGFPSLFTVANLRRWPDSFMKLGLSTFSISTVIVFIVGVVTFSLLTELILTLSMTLLATTSEYARRRGEDDKAFTLLTSVQAIIFLSVLSSAFYLIWNQWGSYASWENYWGFIFPYSLWILYLPFIFAAGVVTHYQISFSMLRVKKIPEDLVRYAKWRALIAFGPDINAARVFARHLFYFRPEDREDVNVALSEVGGSIARQRRPLDEMPQGGWDPYYACNLLRDHDIFPGYYFRTPAGWIANGTDDAQLIEIDDFSGKRNEVEFRIFGEEDLVTEISLSANVWLDHNRDFKFTRFEFLSDVMLRRLIGEEAADAISSRLGVEGEVNMIVDKAALRYERKVDEWIERRLLEISIHRGSERFH